MKLTDLLTRYGVPFKTSGHHHCTSGWVQVDCPFCSTAGEGKWRMGVHAVNMNANCWRCGPKKRDETLVKLLGLRHPEVWGLLKGFVPEKIVEVVKVRGTLDVPFVTWPLDSASYHLAYIKSRGFDRKYLTKLWGVQAIKLNSEYGWRLYIPIYFRGEVVSWTTRAITDDVKAKYLTAKPSHEKVHLKRLLYGEDYARNAVVICEGPTDVWRVGPGAVCTFGVGYGAAQVNRMVRYAKRVVCFDSEPAAQERASALADTLAAFPGETEVVQLDAKDPGSASAKEVKRLRALAFD